MDLPEQVQSNFPAGCEVFGMSGKIGSGKDYIASQILLPMLPKKPTLIISLADQLKIDACVKNDIAYERIFIKKDDQSRKILQLRGTEEGRNKYRDDIWIRTIEAWMRLHSERGIRRFILCDIRFKNEVAWLKQNNGHLIRIISLNRSRHKIKMESNNNPDIESRLINHQSETDLDDIPVSMFDIVIDNDYGQEDLVYLQMRDYVLSLDTRDNLVIFCDLDDTICYCSCLYNEVISKVFGRFNVPSPERKVLENLYINNFASRPYAKDDFASSLLAMMIHHYQSQDKSLTQAESEWIVMMGMSVYDKKYDYINSDISNVINALANMSKFVIFTLGDRLEQTRKICQLGLHGYDYEIFPHKDVEMFRYLKTKYPAHKYAMIGDSLTRDILPAQQAGIHETIHIGGLIFQSLNQDVVRFIDDKFGTHT